MYIYTNLLPFLLQLDWVVVFLFYRHSHWLQEQLDSPREDNVLWDIFCLFQCQHLWHPLILLWNNWLLFNQIQPLQFASYSFEIEILISMQSWGHKANMGHWLLVYPIQSSSLLPPCPIQVCADHKFDNQVQLSLVWDVRAKILCFTWSASWKNCWNFITLSALDTLDRWISVFLFFIFNHLTK